jgi:hypothetical protein
MSILGWRKQMVPTITEGETKDQWWQKRQMVALTIMKIQDGGFIVYEDNFEMGLAKKILFADGDIGMALQYIRDKMTIPAREP